MGEGERERREKRKRKSGSGSRRNIKRATENWQPLLVQRHTLLTHILANTSTSHSRQLQSATRHRRRPSVHGSAYFNVRLEPIMALSQKMECRELIWSPITVNHGQKCIECKGLSLHMNLLPLAFFRMRNRHSRRTKTIL